jgi:hypothetical protein
MFAPYSTGFGHKSLETTMRYLVPSQEVHARLDQVTVPGLDDAESAKGPARVEGSCPGANHPAKECRPNVGASVASHGALAK